MDAGPTEPVLRRLLRSQFPQWGDLPLSRLNSSGVDNLLFRLGDELLVRLPRNEALQRPLEKEQAWLPRLSPHLPLATPRLIGIGRACADYPWTWSISAWIDGDVATEDRIGDWRLLASDLAGFIRALRAIASDGGPAPGEHNFWRGVNLASRDKQTRKAVADLGDLIDGPAALAAWEADSRAAQWDKAPLWLHGDIHAQNLLTRDGRLCAVIDFGGLGVGDPACDLIAAWRLLPRSARDTFRAALDADPQSWRRGRAWALSISLVEVCHYRNEAPTLTAIANRTIREVLGEHAGAAA